MSKGDWVQELPAEIMVCDPAGIILEMNAEAEVLFAEEGGRELLGSSLLDCHPNPALDKLKFMLEHQAANAYFSTENNQKRFFFQSPWYQDKQFSGLVEISFTVPEIIPHFTRE